MIDAYIRAIRQYTTFDGRTSRYDYWMYSLCFAGLMFAAFILEGLLGLGSNDVRPLMGLVSIAHLVPNVAITARRLHDQDRTAWWLLLWLTGIGTIVTFIFTLLPGIPNTNRFGPPTVSAGNVGHAAAQSDATATARAQAPQLNLTEELERLAQMRSSGSLTDAEFNVMKQRLLNRAG